MQIGAMLKLKAIILSIAIMTLNGQAMADDIAQTQAADGTYHIETVASQDVCGLLCNNDTKNICRGYNFIQFDVRIPRGECRLNNGLGDQSDYKIDKPEPINIEQVLADMNHYRAEYGLQPLKWNSQLEAAATVHALDLAAHGVLQHEGTDGSSAGERVERQGYVFSITLENVAAGQKNWENVLQSWKDSPGHNQNLLHKDAREIGVAFDFNPKTRFAIYWAMVLGTPLNPVD